MCYTENCRIELEPRSGVLEPREEKSIIVHFIANRTVGICVIQRIVELSWNPEVESACAYAQSDQSLC